MSPSAGRRSRVSDAGDKAVRPEFEGLPVFAWTIDTECSVRPAFTGLSQRARKLAEALPAGAELAHRRALAGEPSTYVAEVDARYYRVYVEPWREDAAIVGALGIAVDATPELRAVDSLRRSQENLARQAHYDELTQLPNRKLLVERLTGALARARRDGSRVAILFVDLDRFKTINESLGHAVGDRFLRACAKRISGIVRDTDIVARLGNDEFIVALTDIRSPDGAARVAQNLLDAFGERFSVEDKELYTSISIGIGLFPDDGATGEELIRAADAALSRAKSLGGNGLCFYSAPVHRRAVERLMLESQIRRALDAREFALHYQPTVDLSGSIVGVEALVRWQHPNLGLIFPDAFITLCEEIGAIVPLGRWVMRNALAQMADWTARGIDVGRLALNISARQLRDPELAKAVREALEENGFPAERLELEITESAVMGDLGGAKRAVDELKALGVGLALDDFGTGYSTLSYLKHFPVDALKIDRSFMSDLPGERGDVAIVAAIVALGHALGLRVTAEGVETPAQAALASQIGCDEMQGFHFARPLPPSEIEEFVFAQRADARDALSS